MSQKAKAAENPVESPVLNTQQACQFLGGIGRLGLDRLVQKGLLKRRKVLGLNMYAVVDLREVLGL